MTVLIFSAITVPVVTFTSSKGSTEQRTKDDVPLHPKPYIGSGVIDLGPKALRMVGGSAPRGGASRIPRERALVRVTLTVLVVDMLASAVTNFKREK